MFHTVSPVHSQDGHAKSEPKVLLADDVDPVRVPRMSLEVVRVTKDDKDPCRDESKPANKAMVTFKHTEKVFKYGEGNE
jgi:hypothetical protein